MVIPEIEKEFVEDKGTQYMYCHLPKHPCANKAGKVLEHVYVVCKHIGRLLTKQECVHHIDRNRKNNNLSNLRLMSRVEHRKLHAREDQGYQEETKNCPSCNRLFTASIKDERKYCSATCSQLFNRVFEISKENLTDLVWKMPSTHIAKLLNVSDVAISKRCKLLGIEKPKRGYWVKVKYGLIKN